MLHHFRKTFPQKITRLWQHQLNEKNFSRDIFPKIWYIPNQNPDGSTQGFRIEKKETYLESGREFPSSHFYLFSLLAVEWRTGSTRNKSDCGFFIILRGR